MAKKPKHDDWLSPKWSWNVAPASLVAQGWKYWPNVTLKFDGGCDRNPGGIPTFGWNLFGTDNKGLGDVIAEERGFCIPSEYKFEERTSNTAEWAGVCDGLQWMKTNRVIAGRLTIVGDSRLVLNQLAGRWSSQKPHLLASREEAREYLGRVCALSFQTKWIPREQNDHCHRLASLALREAKQDPECVLT